MKSILISVFSIGWLTGFSNLGIAQNLNSNNVYLFYVLDAGDSSIAKRSDLFAARMVSPFSEADYSKVLNLSAQRIWSHATKGDSLQNIDFGRGLSSFYTPYNGIESTQYLSLDDLNKDATYFGPLWPGIDGTIPNFDRFRFRNGEVYSDKLILDQKLQFVISMDTAAVADSDGNLTFKVLYNYLDPAEMALSFVEKWSFDPSNGKFVKEVSKVGYLKLREDPFNGNHLGYSPTIYLDNPNGIFVPKSDVLLKKNVVCEESVRWAEADLLSDTSITSSASEAIIRLQDSYSNIPSFERVKFLSSLFYYAFHNPSQTFPIKNNVVDSIHPFKTAVEISNLFYSWDSTNQIEYPENSGILINAPLKSQVSIGDVYAIRFYEDWYYDPREMTIKKKVNGIGFVLLKQDKNGKPYFADAGIYIKMK